MRECANAQIQNLRMRMTHRFSIFWIFLEFFGFFWTFLKFFGFFWIFLEIFRACLVTTIKQFQKNPKNSPKIQKNPKKMDPWMKKMTTNEDFWTRKLGAVREPKFCACARRTGFAPKPVVIIFYVIT